MTNEEHACERCSAACLSDNPLAAHNQSATARSCLAARLDGPNHAPYLCQRDWRHEGQHSVIAPGFKWEWS